MYEFSFIKEAIAEARKENEEIFPEEIPKSLMINSKMKIDSLLMSKFRTTSFIKGSGNLSGELERILEENQLIKIDDQTEKVINPEKKNLSNTIKEMVLMEEGTCADMVDTFIETSLKEILKRYELECGIAEFLTLIADVTTRKLREQLKESSS